MTTRLGIVGMFLAATACAAILALPGPALALEAGMPNPPASPTEVRCAIVIVDIVNIDDVNESFEAELAIMANWHDPRLAFDPEKEGTTRKIFQGDYQFAEVFNGWWPQFVIVNEVGRGDTKGVKIEVQPDGLVRYLEMRHAQLETPMSLHDYPFDTQRLKASMISMGNLTDDVVLMVEDRYREATDDYVKREESVNVAGWTLRHLDMNVNENYLADGDGQSRYSQLVTTMTLQRRSWQLVWELLFPMLILVSMMWSVFWIDIESLADRLNLSFIGVLTIVAYQFVVIDDMPRMSYLTFTDTLLLVSFWAMCATIPQSLIIHSLVRKGRHATAKRIDKTSRWAFPLAYAVLIAVTVARYFLM